MYALCSLLTLALLTLALYTQCMINRRIESRGCFCLDKLRRARLLCHACDQQHLSDFQVSVRSHRRHCLKGSSMGLSHGECLAELLDRMPCRAVRVG